MSAADRLPPAAASFLIVAIGNDPTTAGRAHAWTTEAEALAPTTLVLLDDADHPADVRELEAALVAARIGVRILVVGGRYDVLRTVARMREHGAIPAEITAEITHAVDLPIYCAHCRDHRRVAAEPGEVVQCPGCARHLEIHDHLASALGCYLASDARAADLHALEEMAR